MPITIADLVAVLRADNAQYDAAQLRSKGITEQHEAALRRFADQIRSGTGVDRLSKEFQELAQSLNTPRLLFELSAALAKVNAKARATAASIASLKRESSDLFVSLAAGEGKVKSGTFKGVSDQVAADILRERGISQRVAADEMGRTVSVGRNAAAAASMARAEAEDVFTAVANAWNTVYDRNTELQKFRARMMNFSPITQTGSAMSQLQGAQIGGVVDARRNFLSNMAGGPVSPGSAARASQAELAGILSALDSGIASKMDRAGESARQMAGHFSLARMAGFQLGMSLLFTLEPAIGRTATQIIGSSIIAFGMLPAPIAAVTSTIVAGAAVWGEYIERVEAAAAVTARLNIASRDVNLGGVASQVDAARQKVEELHIRRNRKSGGMPGFNAFKVGLDELFEREATGFTTLEQLTRFQAAETDIQRELAPAEGSKRAAGSLGVRARASSAAAQLALNRGDLDAFRTSLNEERELLRQKRDQDMEAINLDETLALRRQRERNQFNVPALDKIRADAAAARERVGVDFDIADLQKIEQAQQQLRTREADRRASLNQTLRLEMDVQLARARAGATALTDERQYEAAIRKSTEARILEIRARSERELRDLDVEVSRMDPGERAAQGLNEGGAGLASRRAAIRDTAGADISGAMSQERTQLRENQKQRLDFVQQYEDRVKASEASLVQARLEAEFKFTAAAMAEADERVRQVNAAAERERREVEASKVEAAERADALTKVEAERANKVAAIRTNQAVAERKYTDTRLNFVQQYENAARKSEADLLQTQLAAINDSVAASRARTTQRISSANSEYERELRNIRNTTVEAVDMERARAAAARTRAAEVAAAAAAEFEILSRTAVSGAASASSLLSNLPTDPKTGRRNAPQTLEGLGEARTAQQQAIETLQSIRAFQEIGFLDSNDARTAIKEYADAVERSFEQIQKKFSGDSATNKIFDKLIAQVRKGGLEGVMDGLKSQIEKVGAAAGGVDGPLAVFQTRLDSITGSASTLVDALAALEGAMNGGGLAGARAAATRRPDSGPAAARGRAPAPTEFQQGLTSIDSSIAALGRVAGQSGERVGPVYSESDTSSDAV